MNRSRSWVVLPLISLFNLALSFLILSFTLPQVVVASTSASVAQCIQNTSETRTAGGQTLNARDQYEIEARCQGGELLIPTQYTECAMAQYNQLAGSANDFVLSATQKSSIQTRCSGGTTPASTSSNPSTSTSSNANTIPSLSDVSACINRNVDNQTGNGATTINSRQRYQIDALCQSERLIAPVQYQQCAMREYDALTQAQSRSLTDADRQTIITRCAPAPSAANSSGPAATGGSTPTTGTRSGAVPDLPFTTVTDPYQLYNGSVNGANVGNLASSYAQPLLRISDRQSAFRILVNFFTGIISIVALLFLVVNGYRYAMARGEDSQISQAKKGIIYAVVGLVLVIASYTIIATVLNFGAQNSQAPGISVGVGVNF
ncbi:hypothetical protein KBB08_01165 [Candidatus Gracilibacteria bacterium]|nr:hypothetical protein [Candidatus Gracilibacteria bacterium]